MESAERIGAGRADDGEAAPVVALVDYVCPYCYMAESLLARLREETDVAVDYRAFELRPPPMPLLDPDDPGLRRVWRDTIEPLAGSLGVEIRRPPVQPRSRKAHEAAAHARVQGRFDVMRAGLFRAFFVEGRDIGRVDVLLDIGERAGLERAGLKVTLDIDRWAGRVAAEQEAALAAGVDAVPAIVIGEETLVGLPAYDELRERVRTRVA